ncbi:helix-turn-helix domain-containing protein [Avibacterium paragallinarum]|uniref:Transcriptional regulator n=1 Tax=Avibacterium paragallinarum TaxID=728 RepID=A0AAE5WHM2_AVIPA|nr:helix-turn-helix transcriptional regulator [Avibacterium paragallinarum]MEE3609704.1 helix-turn-helix transcriptional regulator [Avibacterium paragallinarum]MEE3621737.1 helix-turn-helix transcriptional regulator [Avibacterium paragallinarum]MEE3669485.1 helix-turn-helix transcriptional regulator [Avibacterium paragallinarum]MEE3681793.1 helix-turn-helix transcriptional regulator [Avibacterium paragallinarum]MEE4387041.1 helix-turn-helix transcriptional regulator [Avibacterium paragallinaru
MTTHTNIQIINDHSGVPAFVVIPYAQYIAQQKLSQRDIDLSDAIPSEVVDLALDRNYSALRAWREYLGLTQIEIAKRLGITQAAYSQHEKAKYLRPTTRNKIANALGINPEQLDF